MNNKYTLPNKTFNSLLKFFSKNYFDGVFKHKTLSYLVDSYLNLVLIQANKISILANRNKLNFYDLINSINVSSPSPFKLGRPNSYRILKKNKKLIKNYTTKFADSTISCIKIWKKLKIPRIFLKWIHLPRKKAIEKKLDVFKKISFRVFNYIPLNETLFLCYSFNTIFKKIFTERNICIKIVSDNYNFRTSSNFFFFYAINFVITNRDTKKVLIGLRIIHAITLNNIFSIHYIYKKIVSVLTDLILNINLIKQNKKLLKTFLYSYRILKQVEKISISSFDFFLVKKKYFFLRKLFGFYINKYEILEWVVTVSKKTRFENELFIRTILKNTF